MKFLKKSLGQNFLVDKNIINKIINAARISSDDVVLEIGPGTGNLTKFIIFCYDRNAKKLRSASFVQSNKNQN